MNLNDGLLLFFIVLAAGSALGVLFVRNVLYGSLFLIICLLCLAGIYIFLQAEFLAVTQIMIYAGGILVLLIFGIMLTIRKGDKPLVVGSHHLFSGSLVGLGLLFLLIYSLGSASLNISQSQQAQQNNVTRMGTIILSDYVIAFELAGVLLLITLLGASIMASISKNE
jgi:NADH-quinone oxidoreductase subunit J